MAKIVELKKESSNERSQEGQIEQENPKINDKRGVERTDNNGSDNSDNKSADGSVRCKYDNRFFCRVELGDKTNEEQVGCDVCLKIQNRGFALSNELRLKGLEKRLTNIEGLIQAVITKILIPK